MAGEKTEEPTPQKLRKAREEGQISKSQDFVSALGFAGSFATLSLALTFITKQFTDLFIEVFKAINSKEPIVSMFVVLDKSFQIWLFASLPVLAAAVVLGVAGNYFQIGF